MTFIKRVTEMPLLQLPPPTREKETMWRQPQTTTTQVWADEETTTFQELFSLNKQQHHVRRKQQPDAVTYPELPPSIVPCALYCGTGRHLTEEDGATCYHMAGKLLKSCLKFEILL